MSSDWLTKSLKMECVKSIEREWTPLKGHWDFCWICMCELISHPQNSRLTGWEWGLSVQTGSVQASCHCTRPSMSHRRGDVQQRRALGVNGAALQLGPAAHAPSYQEHVTYVFCFCFFTWESNSTYFKRPLWGLNQIKHMKDLAQWVANDIY